MKADERIREMKSYSHLYEKIIDEDNLKLAIKNAIKGRTKKRRKKIKQYIENTDEAVKKLKRWIEEYRNDIHTPVQIYDGISRKKREIIVPTFKELAVQHAIVQVLKPIFLKGAYKHSYAATPGKGAHLGKKYMEKWIRKDIRNCKYVLKMDIKKFFPSIPHDKLKDKLARTFRDKKLLQILFEIVDVTDIGIPLGFYTSQWFSNWYLQKLDHYIKEDLKAVYYIRFMDDMVILGANKRKLHRMRDKIENYLNNELGLELKANWQVYRFDHTKGNHTCGKDIDFMGFRFYRKKTTMRRSIMLKATRTARKIAKKEKATIYDIRKMLSYLGWITHTDTYGMYLKWIKPYISFQYFKRRMSVFDHKQNKETKNGFNLRAA